MCEKKCLFIGNKLFFIDKEALLLKIYYPLSLAKIQLTSDDSEMIVDIKCLRNEPDLTNSIPLSIWR
ncbi:MAG: hypothetical protein FIA99_09350 [Ruminiclostridium sp.]|nr:hypothetical protein [Ruminiclostridium sp.]